MTTNEQTGTAQEQWAQSLVQWYLQTLLEHDIESWMNLWDEHCLLELPFAPEGRPSRIEGKEALYRYIQTVMQDLEVIDISQQDIYPTLHPDLVIAEVTGKGRLRSTGRTYTQSYVWIMRTKDGKLTHMRDYWNPLASVAARENHTITPHSGTASEQDQQ